MAFISTFQGSKKHQLAIVAKSAEARALCAFAINFFNADDGGGVVDPADLDNELVIVNLNNESVERVRLTDYERVACLEFNQNLCFILILTRVGKCLI